MTRERNIDECRTIALKLLDSPRGREAVQGGYYVLQFNWLYGEIERGRIPAGVPVRLVERWQKKVAKHIK